MKRVTSFDLALPARKGGVAAYEWLYGSLREQILDARLRPGTRLPATREFARQLGIARGTVVAAFDQLKAEGYLSGTVGSGTYVASVVPDTHQRIAVTEHSKGVPTRRRLSNYSRRARPFTGFEDRPTRAFRSNLPALDLFPVDLWSKIVSQRMRGLSTRVLTGSTALGYQPLRESIADYLTTSRGVRCTAEQIAIVSGVQDALDITARLFVNPGDRVCVEDPGYPGATLAFRAVGAKVSLLALDRDGPQIRPAAMNGARLVYVTPAHQFPTGITMSLARRLELIEWARREGAIIFEDDYDSEFRYSSRPLPAMQGLDRHGCVLFAGSFSKVLFPSLRIGYLVVPPDLVDYVASTISITSRHAPMLEQAVLCDFITGGHFARHLRRMREVYARRLHVLQEAVRSELAGTAELADIEAGLQTALWLAPTVDARNLAERLSRRDVQVTPLSSYAQRPMKRDGLQLGFAPVNEKEIRRGVEELTRALME